MKHYYIPFVPKARINYLYLLALYEKAEYRTETKAFDTIRYSSISKLAASLNISSSTMNRIISTEDYSFFFSVNKEDKVITLNSSFVKGTNKPFVCLNEREVQLMREVKDNLFSAYLVYLKYYCGFAAGKQDFTAKQFLAACGYSVRSNEMISRISGYNRLLTEHGFLKIIKYRDELGHERNSYSYL